APSRSTGPGCPAPDPVIFLDSAQAALYRWAQVSGSSGCRCLEIRDQTPRGPQVLRRFCLSSISGGPPAMVAGFTEARASEEVSSNGTGNGQVVQRCKGLWLHHPGG